MNKSVIEIRGVSFGYNENEKILKHVNLKIEKGEVVVLCGESGCGKSTIIRLVNGLIPFYFKGYVEGQVNVLGKSTQESTIYDLGNMVSTVFQNPRSQFFCVGVKSELAFGAENLKYSKEEIEKRIENVCCELNCNHLLDRTMFQLSGGEKQKIACASVSVTDNPIIVLDEPSSNLDMPAIADLKAMIEYWKQKGKIIVIAEHRLQYLQEIADRFIYMRRGEIICEFTAGEMRKLTSAELADMGLRNLSYDNLDIQNKTVISGFMKISDFYFQYRGRKERSLSIPELRIPKESVVAIIGKNGAGKSTFVRCLCGLEKKIKGTLEDGNLKKTKDRLKDSFLVMQDVNRQLFTESVEEEILLSMDTKNEKELEEILKDFDLYEVKRRHPMSLSGGQKQRVAVACAIASKRKYVVFDEPTSGLDYFHMKQIAECIIELQKKKKTVFLITHDVELVFACCNYVIQVKNGAISDMYQMNKENEIKVRSFFR